MPQDHKPPGLFASLLRILRQRPRIPQSLAENPLLETILQRRTQRHFKDQPIPEDVFQAVLEAGRLAPSTVNLQTWSFAVFTRETWQSTFQKTIPFKGQRAVIILADTHRGRQVLDTFPQSPLVEYTIGVMNASLAAMNMNLAAEALGVSSVMLSETGQTGLLDAKYLQGVLALPSRVVPLMTIIFGYADRSAPPMPPKLPLDVVAFEGAYPDDQRHILQDWLAEMKAGYKAMRPLSSFEAQLSLYASKIGKAEADLRKMVFGEGEKTG